MGIETLSRDTAPTDSGNSNNTKPPIETTFPGGDDDDYLRRQAEEGIDDLEIMLGKPAPASVSDGWEERARDVHTGRGYTFEEAGPPRGGGLGKIATAAGFSGDRRAYSTGMPRRANVIGSFVTPKSIARY